MGGFYQNDEGRWEIDGYPLTSGSPVEVQLGGYWIRGRVEYSDEAKTYVILISEGKATLLITSGLSVRLRGRS